MKMNFFFSTKIKDYCKPRDLDIFPNPLGKQLAHYQRIYEFLKTNKNLSGNRTHHLYQILDGLQDKIYNYYEKRFERKKRQEQ